MEAELSNPFLPEMGRQPPVFAGRTAEIKRFRRARPGPLALPEWVERPVILVRLLTYWNAKRLAAEFTRREIHPLEHNAVSALFARYGTARPSIHRPRGPRYERGVPNELWHIDIKGPFFLRAAAGYRKVWIVGLVDDHSRYLIGLRVLPRPAQAVVLPWLRDCFELCGTPLELKSDNGSPFVVWMPGVLTLFGQTLATLRVRHLRTQINSPWTSGKIERVWGTLRAEVLDRQVLSTPEAADAALGGLLQLPSPARRDRLVHAGRALRRDGLHRPWLRVHPGPGASSRLAHRPHGVR
jgi:transposase InsO family protein